MENQLSVEALEKLAVVYKALGNPKRLHILSTLKGSAMTFGAFLKELGYNPKTLNDNLEILINQGLIFKSFQHENYVLTPMGHAFVEKFIEDGHSFINKFKQESK